MSIVSPASNTEVDQAILAARTNPRGVTSRQRELINRAAQQAGSRGNEARAALGQK